jgi:hypothetical protein
MKVLGDVKARQGDETASLRLHQATLRKYTQALGDNHRTAAIRIRLSDHFLKAKDYKTAL